jgi:hypothetical protein
MNGACGDFEDGEYYDTVAANGCLVRFDLNPATSSVYEGRTIMHCHILAHEDQGAMSWFDVVAGIDPSAVPIGPPTFPDPSQQALYDCAAGPPVCVPTEEPEFSCSDGLDNDCDGAIDSADSDCAAPPPPTECSLFDDRKSCKSDQSCRWDNKNDLCVAK